MSQAASNGTSNGTFGNDNVKRVEVTPDGLGIASNVAHEVNELLGGTTNVRVNDITNIQNDMVVGSWSLAEEDGLRTCSMAFATNDNDNSVQVSPGCSESIAAISEWGVFGEDLLLRDSDNAVIVRLRQSSNTWVGFTLVSGIPIVLTR